MNEIVDNPVSLNVIESVDLTFKLQCEAQLKEIKNQYSEAQKTLAELEKSVLLVEGMSLGFDTFLKEKYKIPDNAKIDAETGIIMSE